MHERVQTIENFVFELMTMFHNDNETSRTLSTSSVSISEGYTSPSELTDELDHLNYDNDESREVVIVQFAQKVLDFSSQYGSDYSISYTACNIAGRPSKFPNYGDFPETFAMVCASWSTQWLQINRKLSGNVQFLFLCYREHTDNGGSVHRLVFEK